MNKVNLKKILMIILAFVVFSFAFLSSIPTYAEEANSGQEVENVEEKTESEVIQDEDEMKIEVSDETAETDGPVEADVESDDKEDTENYKDEELKNDDLGEEVESTEATEELKKVEENSEADVVSDEENSEELDAAVNVLGSGLMMRAMVARSGAKGTPQVVEATITEFTIEKPQGTVLTEVNKNDSFYLAMDWKVNDANAILHEGDYFDIKLPDNMRFPPSFSTPVFDLKNDEGEVIAQAVVTPGPEYAGGTIRVTFNDKINDKYNVKGTIYLGALFNKKLTVDNEINTFEVSIDGVPATTQVKVTKTTMPEDHMLSKWGERNTVGGQPVNTVRWRSTINYSKSNLVNCVISDEITQGSATYIAGTFKLVEVEYNDEGGVVREIGDIDISDKVVIAPDGKSFSINLGNIGTKQLRLSYDTTYDNPGEVLRNRIKINNDGNETVYTSTFRDSAAGGTAGGELASKIKITKVDADDNSLPLAGAVFEIKRPDGTTFELTTGADGTVTSGVLTQGTYTAKEIVAPTGYEINNEEFTLEVTPTGGALKTITNKPIKIDIDVEKKWVGPEQDKVIIHLLADGQDTGKTLELSADNGWEGTFTDLNKYANGEEIVYTVVEDTIANYDSDIKGDVANGFTITNTNTEVVFVVVFKKWEGPKKDEVTVRLFADGTEVDAEKLNEASGWEYTFGNLAKYNADGSEIVYTVEEDEIENYSSEIKGSALDGFIITNTNTEKIRIPVIKKWNLISGEEQPTADVVIVLYSDGEETDQTLTLNVDNNWEDAFENLPKYDIYDGHEIVYTIKEVEIIGYESEIEGDAQNGFTITNTQKFIGIEVTKIWNGGSKPDTKIELWRKGFNALGEEINELVGDFTANASTTKAVFENLVEYDASGNKYEYYVVEPKVPANYKSSVDGYTVTNKYEAPPTPPTTPPTYETPNNPVVPKTGSGENMMIYIGGILIALMAIAGLNLKREG